MSISEYNGYYRQHLRKIVESYVEEKYKDSEVILCVFEPYFVNEGEGCAHCYDTEIVELSIEDYVQLLFVVVAHRGVTFEELPLYIPTNLYKQVLGSFRFIHYMGPGDHPIVLEECASPMAVVMSTLRDDANEIIGDEMVSILVQSCKKCNEFNSVDIHAEIWMGLVEVTIYRYVGEDEETRKSYIYGMINEKAFLRALGVQSCDEVASVLWRMCKNYTSKNISDITWIVQWLDSNGIKYVFAEGEQRRELDRFQFVYR